MARPHIEFIHAPDLPWQRDRLPGPLAALETKVLSLDADTGACSVILRYPPGYRAEGPQHLTASHEFYVLDGAIVRSGESYGMDCYGYLPAGHTEGDIVSRDGAVVLTFFDAAPQRRPGPGTLRADATPAVPRLDLHAMAWTAGDIDPDVQFLRIVHKVLRHDPRTGEKTLVLDCGAQTHPRNWRERALAHPCVEEMFLLSGDIVGERGVMTAGAYFWRPPHEWHGPFGSRYGNVCLIRFLDGHHVNLWGPEELSFRFDPPHAPKLPPELAAYGATPHPFSRPY
jgi:hypothetical protein